MAPDIGKIGMLEFVQNWLVGQQGVHDSVRMYFMDHLNPYA